MNEEQEVRAAVRRLVGDDEDEIQRMLARYEGCYATVRAYFRGWLEVRLGEQAEWMLRLINIKRIADMAVKRSTTSAVPSSSSPTTASSTEAQDVLGPAADVLPVVPGAQGVAEGVGQSETGAGVDAVGLELETIGEGVGLGDGLADVRFW